MYHHKDGLVNALYQVDLLIEKGSFVTITGPSGSGKTTLLLTIGGLLQPNIGKILFNGLKLDLGSESHMAEFRKQHIGYVMQSFALIPYLTATENVMVGYTNNSSNGTDKRAIATAVLDVVDLADRKNHYPRELSAGQQQRVAIARALVKKPTFILADEPTGNLDPALSVEILNLLKDINQEKGITVIMVTHSPAAANMGTVKIHLKDGKIVNS
ncbi:MAG: ABC transporter ATP-binding protein [Bacteroidetes bacterium]|nr:ABC transporter ATP-binding protein [Bacteroidota bacterium]